MLTGDQARQLLARIGDVQVEDISQAATTNDVFRVITRRDGVFFIKFHTARWYADQPDTAFVVEREAAACELLRKRGMPLPYVAWADVSRSVVSRSVFVCGELPGMPVTEAIGRFPEEANDIAYALGGYLRRLHEIEFASAGILCREHVRLAPPSGVIPPVESWDEHSMHHPRHFQREALAALERARESGLLPKEVAIEIEQQFANSAKALRSDYLPPRFTVGNCHAYHFHVNRIPGHWEVQGLYDFEAVSAGDATIDLVELETTLVPAVLSYDWRQPLFSGYGRWPELGGYRLRLLYYLLGELGREYSRMVPDAEWLASRWSGLLAATSWDGLDWFPLGSGR